MSLRVRGLNLEADAVAALEEADDLEQIGGARVAHRTQHPHQAFTRNADRFGRLGKIYRALM